MKYLQIIAICVFLSSCKNESNDGDFGAFQIALPKGWKKFKEKGIDSYVGGVTNGKDSLIFDYGLYSYDLNNEEISKQHFAEALVNGKEALITKPKQTGFGTIGIYIKEAYKDNSFNLIGRNINNEQTVLTIFKSILFKDGDTTKNSMKLEFSNKITPQSGKHLFMMNCAACHHAKKSRIGPALSSFEYQDYAYYILGTNEGVQDTSEYGIVYHRQTFGSYLTLHDLEKIINYINLNSKTDANANTLIPSKPAN